MKNQHLFFFLLTIFLLTACSAVVKTKLADQKYPVARGTIAFTEEEQDIPRDAKFVGYLKVGDSGFSTECDYNTVRLQAESKARLSGANLVYISELKSPNLASTCYRFKARMYRISDTTHINKIVAKNVEKNKSRLPPDADYAKIYFYRDINFIGSLIGYKIRTSEKEVIGSMRNGAKFEYQTSAYGRQVFYAHTESIDSVVVHVVPGQEYFVRCSVSIGVVIGRPQMKLIENSIGVEEYNSL